MQSIGGEESSPISRHTDHNLEELQRLRKPQFDAAKRWWAMAMMCRLLVLGVSLASVFIPQFLTSISIASGGLTIIYVLFQWRADTLKSSAESILRRIEFASGLGWEITGRELRDLKLSMSSLIRRQAIKETGHYFSSPSESSPSRLIENLEESTYFTKHLAQSMFYMVSLIAILIFVLGIITLTVALEQNVAQPLSTQLAKIVITIIVFIFSAGYVRLAHRYQQFSLQANLIDERANTLLRTNFTEVEAIILLHDYQIARTNAPLLPSWLWRLREKELNDLWEKHRAK